MRLQILFFLVVLAIICEQQCSAEDEKPSFNSARKEEKPSFESARKEEKPSFESARKENKPRKLDGWDEEENYKDDADDDEKEWNDKKPYNKDKNDKSNGRRPSYDDDDDNSYDTKPSYKDDDDKSYGRKPSYNDDDDKSYDTKPSYNDDDDDDDYKPADYGSSRQRKSPDELGHMNIYLREPSRDGKRKKPKRFRFPVARYERRRFPNTFGPLISFLPWLPIFADRLTKQTIIYSPTGGVYIIPPVINFYGKLISVAQLIASGYASLVSSGAPPPPSVNVAPLVQPGPVVGPGVPAVNPATGGFKGGVRTDFRSFSGPKYPKTLEEGPNSPQQDEPVRPRGGY